MTDQSSRTRLLIEAYLDQGVSPAELAELEQRLIDDPAARSEFARATRFDYLLEQHHRLARSSGIPDQSVVASTRNSTLRRVVAAAAVVAALATASLLYFNRPVHAATYPVVSGRVLVDGRAASEVADGARIEVVGAEPARLQLADGAQAELEPATTAVLSSRGNVLNIAVTLGQVLVDGAENKYTVKAGESRDIKFEKKLSFIGRVVAVADDGRSLTLEGPPPKPGAAPAQAVVRITEQTHLKYYGMPLGGDQPTVGVRAVAWLDKAHPDQAQMIEFGSKEPTFAGPVVEVGDDARRITISVYRKNAEPLRQEILIDDATRLDYSGIGAENVRRPTVGYGTRVWQADGASTASEIQFSVKNAGDKQPAAPVAKPQNPTTEKPGPEKKPLLPTPTKPVKKLEPPPEEKPATKVDLKPGMSMSAMNAADKTKPAEKTKSVEKQAAAPLVRRVSPRDPVVIAAAIDREVSQALARAGLAPSPQADDAEFVRRVTLDLAGRIPTLQQTVLFLDRPDAADRVAARRAYLESLLASQGFADHFARCWKRLIAPPDLTSTKMGVDRFTPWLAEQFAANRPWSEVVSDLLTGDDNPRWAFYQANSDMSSPKPSLLAASTGRLFLGVRISCAECHNHPFAPWTQDDFWSLAAFYGKVRKRSKGDFTLTEAPEAGASATTDGSITIPEGSGKGTGKVVQARFLDGASPRDRSAPLRPQLAAWLVDRENPYFARATVNRLWAHFFGRGLVDPVDDLRPGNEASHPQLLRLLADEFIASNFDVQHLARCICLSETYQRSSLPTAANEHDPRWLSHHTVRVLSPDQLYDSLAIVLHASPVVPSSTTGKSTEKIGTPKSELLGTRDSFVRAFGRTADDAPAEQFSYGIPQVLQLLNAAHFNVGAPLVPTLLAREADAGRRIETLYLIALSRRPSAEETKAMLALIGDRAESSEGYAAVLWVLINSSEFVVNR